MSDLVTCWLECESLGLTLGRSRGMRPFRSRRLRLGGVRFLIVVVVSRVLYVIVFVKGSARPTNRHFDEC